MIPAVMPAIRPLCIWLLAALVAGSTLLVSQIRQQMPDENRQQQVLLRLLIEQQQSQPSEREKQEAERRAAEYQAHEFVGKVNDFTTAFNALTAEMREKGTANLKKFEAAEKAWRKLTSDPGWLFRNKKQRDTEE